MPDEFGAMLDRVQANKIEENRKMRLQHEQAQEEAKSSFDLKAECLRTVVRPFLDDAEKALGAKGVGLKVWSNLDERSYGHDPEISFCFQPTLAGSDNYNSHNTIYFILVSHTSGGVRCGSRSRSPQIQDKPIDLSKNFGISHGDKLDRSAIAKFFEYALSKSYYR